MKQTTEIRAMYETTDNANDTLSFYVYEGGSHAPVDGVSFARQGNKVQVSGRWTTYEAAEKRAAEVLEMNL